MQKTNEYGKLEVHLIQPYPYSCLNRDDTNMPKQMDLGGYVRGRVSSQCQKRHMRHSKVFQTYVPDIGVRTKELFEQALRESGVERTPQSEEVYRKLILAVGYKTEGLAAGKKNEGGDEEQEVATEVQEVESEREEGEAEVQEAENAKASNRSNNLFFVDLKCRDNLATILRENWSKISAIKPKDIGGEGKGGKKAKKEVPDSVKEVVAKIKECLRESGKSEAVAAFGRMLAADSKSDSYGVDGAVHVMHAFTTHAVQQEYDYFTAVDDLNEDNSGAGMLGHAAYQSGVYYRHMGINLDDFVKNIGGGNVKDRLAATVNGLIRSFVDLPLSAKIRSCAHTTLPSFVMVVHRTGQMYNLSGAFLNPVRPTQNESIADSSARRLVEHWNKLKHAYAFKDVKKVVCMSVGEGEPLKVGDEPPASTIDNLYEAVIESISSSTKGR